MGEVQARARAQTAAKPFAAALRGDFVRVIAEIKRSSPSKGVLAPQLDAQAQAARFVAGGAAAISVLTEPTRFGGSLDDLAAVSSHVSVPVIRKDFIVAPIQLWEARAAGASAALVIVRALSPAQLDELAAAATEVGIALLVEVRTPRELDRALAIEATVVGVNNRNLETLVIDPSTAPALISGIPGSVVAIAESGMSTADDVAPAATAGADAILVGSALSVHADPTAAVAALSRIPRRARTTT
ncbi:MAG: indole-3-glycerol-phosphate synthase [Gemmatimonadaceae bacterium]|nr:indole-3-glycerol-phosphate synthase [Gemmatimonadaceae bacterium]